MLPQIRYVTAADGVNVAYWTFGSGPPLLMTPLLPVGHAQLEWRMHGFRDWYERLAEGRQLIGYDARGSGLSDRNPGDYSLEAHRGDLEAIVSALALDTFDLFGVFHAGAVAVAYTAAHPERVRRLVVWGSYLQGSDYTQSPRIQSSRALMTKDWEAYLEAFALYAFGWLDEKEFRQAVDLLRESITQEGMLRAIAEIATFDVTEAARRVTRPTLVMQARQAPWPPMDAARRLSAAIPGAQLRVIEGDHVLPWGNDQQAIVEAMSQFLALEPERPTTTPGVAGAVGAATGLSERETEVLRLVAQGQSNKEIAGELSLSVHTIERHLANIYAKIGARGRTDAAAYAHKNGIV